jgi:hypothetical protein
MVDPSHKGRQIYTWISISVFRWLKSHEHCNRNHDISTRDIPKAKRFCVGPQRSR